MQCKIIIKINKIKQYYELIINNCCICEACMQYTSVCVRIVCVVNQIVDCVIKFFDNESVMN